MLSNGCYLKEADKAEADKGQGSSALPRGTEKTTSRLSLSHDISSPTSLIES